MARQIKIVKNQDGDLNVRGLSDMNSPGEITVAARWQENGEVKSFAWPDYGFLLSKQAGALCPCKESSEDFYSYLSEEYGLNSIFVPQPF